MIVTRYLALAALVSALPSGCNQSLFDANAGDEPGPGPGPGPGGDGGTALPDARMGGGDPDAASVPTTCPLPCTADAFGDFVAEQNEPWRYVEVRPDDPEGTGYDEMTLVASTPPSWTGAGSPAATIASCATPESPACADQTDLLVLSAARPNSTANYPALLWTAPATASYRLRGSWRMPTPEGSLNPQQVYLGRNSQFDYVERQQNFAANTDFPFDVTIDARAGDALSLSAPGGAAGMVGVRFYISQQQLGPGSCRTALDFTDPEPLSNRCGSGAFRDSTPATVDEAGPPGIPGRARQFVAGSSLTYEGDPNDYSKDWTVQFWALLDPGGAGEQWLLSDLDCTNKGGFGMRYDGTQIHVNVLDRGSDVISCAPEGLPTPRSFTASAGWHFFRISGAFGGENAYLTVSTCMDGQLQTVDTITNSEMTTTEPLTLGRLETLPAEFVGRIADLRVFARALPCAGI